VADPHERTSEHRWPAATALLVALALYATVPTVFSPWLQGAVVVVGLLLLVPLLITNPVRFERQTPLTRAIALTQALLLLLANQAAIVALVVTLVDPREDSGTRLLLAAAQVWATNVIAVALVLWELDRGGPVARSTLERKDLPAADLRFSQDEDHDAIDEVASRSAHTTDWRPAFPDYLYSSLSNSMAFSASDSMPLSTRAKGLLGLQALAGFVVLALVIARAVSLLGG